MELFMRVQQDSKIEELIPLKEVYVNPKTKDLNLESVLDMNFVKDFVKKIGISIDDLYVDLNAFINIFVYKSDYFFYSTPILAEFDMFNKQMDFQIQKAKELYAKKDFNALIFYIDKPARIHYLNKFSKEINEEDLKELLIEVYVSSEYGFQKLDKDLFEKYLLNERLTEKEIDEIKEFSEVDNDIVTIYRGEQSLSESYKKAFSWTLDFEVAKRFATRFEGDEETSLYEAKVNINDISAYLTMRSEKEVIISPDKLLEVEKII